MKLRVVFALLAMLVVAPRAALAASGTYAFVNVNVLDAPGGAVLPRQTVVVRDGTIVAVGPVREVKLDATVERIRGDGLYLSPGLMDMHAHIDSVRQLDLYLANGVTTIRNMWGNPKALSLRSRIRSGSLVGPEIYSAGTIIDGAPQFWPGSLEIDDPIDAEGVVRAEKAAGYDFIKVYSNLSLPTLQALGREARAQNIEMSGHIPHHVTMEEAINAGMRTSEHFLGVMTSVMRDRSLENPELTALITKSRPVVAAIGRGELKAEDLIDPDRAAAAAALAARSQHWFVVTDNVMRNFTEQPAKSYPEALRYLTPSERKRIENLDKGVRWDLPADVKRGETVLFQIKNRLIRDFHRAGAKILAGTDYAAFPGWALIGELKTLEEIGLSRADVIRTATTEPANYLGRKGKLGEVSVGAQADLVLLRANPLDSLDAYSQINGVMIDGKWHDRARLDAILAAVERMVAAMTEKVDLPLPK